MNEQHMMLFMFMCCKPPSYTHTHAKLLLHEILFLLPLCGLQPPTPQLLQALAAGELTEAPSSTGAAADAGGDAAAVAVAAAAAAMASEGPQKVPLQLLLEGGALQWLLARDAAASLVVLESRSDLPADVVLQLLQGEMTTWGRLTPVCIYYPLFSAVCIGWPRPCLSAAASQGRAGLWQLRVCTSPVGGTTGGGGAGQTLPVLLHSAGGCMCLG